MSRAEPSSGDSSPMAGEQPFDADLVFCAVNRQKPPSKAQPHDHDQAEAIAKASDGRECLLDPAETEGPFPSDGSNSAHGKLSNVLKTSGIVRRDMRTDIGKTATTAEGQAFDLEITLVNVGQGDVTLDKVCPALLCKV
jgi:hypothetical protein